MIHPLVYEINTRCWLSALAQREGRAVTLANVPESEYARWRHLGFTHIWAMGVWTTGPRTRSLALNDENLRRRFDQLMPDWNEEHVPGSPYAIAAYRVPATLGGETGLRAFREKLHAHGMKLLLDFVPNHLGLDHPWVETQPEFFVRSPGEVAGTFSRQTSAGRQWLAHGRDPNFPPWRDTVQVDYRRPEVRVAMIEILQSIAELCDGVRCDMAMLALNEVFNKTWAHLPAPYPPPAAEFWEEAIPTVRKFAPEFLFLAEAYWGLEARLQSLGFDYIYDKDVYDALVERRYAELRKQLLSSPIGERSARTHFLENHDERRIASVLSPAEHRAAALLVLGLPGMRLLHEGQLHGWRHHVPVQLGHWPGEPAQPEILSMYKDLLAALKASAVGRGECRLLHPRAGPENEGAGSCVIVQWQKSPREVDLVVVNLSPHASQCRVRLEIKEFAAPDWELRDLLGSGSSHLDGVGLADGGINFEVRAHGVHLLRLQARRT
jgi:hypothetical protein